MKWVQIWYGDLRLVWNPPRLLYFEGGSIVFPNIQHATNSRRNNASKSLVVFLESRTLSRRLARAVHWLSSLLQFCALPKGANVNLSWVKSTFMYQYRYYVRLFTDVFISNKFSNNLSYCTLLPKPAEL